jgi:protein-L-isoaspartate O-methyltransferase
MITHTSKNKEPAVPFQVTRNMKKGANKKPILERIAIFLVKKTSNYFWELADTWSYKNDKIASLYNRFIGKEYEKEYQNCTIAASGNVLHIGCGSYPLTEIVLAHCSTGHIVGIDKNQQTVTQARHIIKKNKLDDRITIIHGDGLHYPVEDFDVIIVSSCSLPKVQILQHLFQKAKSNSTIIVREVDIASQDITDCLAAYKIIELKKQVRHNPFPFFEPIGWTTFCLIKK